MRARLQHQGGDHQHQQREQLQQFLAIKHFAEDRPCEDRSAAADKAKRKSDQRSRCQSQYALHHRDHQTAILGCELDRGRIRNVSDTS
jgi:hypothetical protein